MAREETQVSKIRELIKERNRQRGETSRIKQKPPPAKRRKLDANIYEDGQEDSRGTQDKPRQEKRKNDLELEPQPTKRRKVYHDIRHLLAPKTSKNRASQEQEDSEKAEQSHILHGGADWTLPLQSL